MALAGRSARRGGAGVRWLAVGLAITLLILLIDASLQSRSPGPGQELAAGVWIDRVLPVITTSNEEGQTIDGIWSNGLKMSAASISSQLDEVATGSAQLYQEVVKLRPPVTLSGQAGLLEASLLARSDAAQILKVTFTRTLGAAASGTTAASLTPAASSNSTAPTTSTSAVPVVITSQAALTAIQTAGSRMQVGDQAYSLFSSTMPARLGVKLPPSVWFSNPGPYQPQTAQVFLESLHSAIETAPVHQVRIYSLSTDPNPVSVQGSTQILPDAATLNITVVVANTGNQQESNLTVTATISPVGKGASSVRDFIDLQPGEAHTIVGLGPLGLPQGVPVTLTVTVTPLAGSVTPAVTESLLLEMPAPPPPSTTTSTTPSTTPTTGPGGTIASTSPTAPGG